MLVTVQDVKCYKMYMCRGDGITDSLFVIESILILVMNQLTNNQLSLLLLTSLALTVRITVEWQVKL